MQPAVIDPARAAVARVRIFSTDLATLALKRRSW
jgi:hypothetical protein